MFLIKHCKKNFQKNEPITIHSQQTPTNQVFGTALLSGCILAITDGNEVVNGLAPFLIGLVVLGIGLAFGLNCGYAINPARDLGPRLWTWTVGYGDGVWT